MCVPVLRRELPSKSAECKRDLRRGGMVVRMEGGGAQNGVKERVRVEQPTMTAVDGCSTTLGTARRQSCLAALPSAASIFQLERLPSHSNFPDASFQIITFRPGVNCFQKVPSPGCCAPRHEQ